MRAPEPLAAFVRDALGAGGDRAAIAAAARAAGWSAPETEAALAAWLDAGGLPPVPRPKALVSARDAFRYGVMFLALLLVAVHLTLLAFALIDLWLPDPLEASGRGGGTIRWSIAVLIITWPVWAVTSLRLAGDEARDPHRRRSAVGQWLTWLALFVAVGSLIGDAVAVVAEFLGGELTLRFLLKAAIVAIVAGAIFLAYGSGREDAG